jgi:hypothetical protein
MTQQAFIQFPSLQQKPIVIDAFAIEKYSFLDPDSTRINIVGGACFDVKVPYDTVKSSLERFGANIIEMRFS